MSVHSTVAADTWISTGMDFDFTSQTWMARTAAAVFA